MSAGGEGFVGGPEFLAIDGRDSEMKRIESSERSVEIGQETGGSSKFAITQGHEAVELLGLMFLKAAAGLLGSGTVKVASTTFQGEKRCEFDLNERADDGGGEGRQLPADGSAESFLTVIGARRWWFRESRAFSSWRESRTDRGSEGEFLRGLVKPRPRVCRDV
jgi:hypothetical protein